MGRKGNKHYSQKGKVPYAVIKAATGGDPAAMDMILKHYERYVNCLSTIMLYDEYGRMYCCVDEELRERLRSKIIKRTLEFKI